MIRFNGWLKADTATTMPSGSRVLKANLDSDALVKPIGTFWPTWCNNSLMHRAIPSIALATSTLASTRGLPPSLAIRKASSAERLAMMPAVFFRTSILLWAGSQDSLFLNRRQALSR